MELVRGIPITDYCDKNQLTPKERLELFVTVCQAIQHAHQKGIIHRDIKPSNVLVTSHDGKPVAKVIDFGVAKAIHQHLTESTIYTNFAQMIGTPLYMSPEQAEMSGLDIDTRSDIYSLGVLLYELLTGTTPLDRKKFAKAAYDEIRRMIREEEPPKPSTRLSSTWSAKGGAHGAANVAPGAARSTLRAQRFYELDWITMKALEKDRTRRYETANGLARDIQRYLADEPVEACPPSATYRLRKFIRRYKGPVVAACVVGLCLLGGTVGTSAGLIWAVRERDEKARALRAATEAKEAEIKERQRKEKALAAEILARENAMKALRALTHDVVEQQMARTTNLTEENKEFLRTILEHYEGWARLSGDDAEGRAIRAEGYLRVGRMRFFLGELKEAEKNFAEAIRLYVRLAADFPVRPECRQNLAMCHNALGVLYYDTGRLIEAEAAYADAIAVQRQLAAGFPDRPEFRQHLAQYLHNQSNLFGGTGRFKQAEDASTEAEAVLKQLVHDFPARPEFRQALAGIQNYLGNILSATGRMKDAEAAYTNSLTVRKYLAAEFPNRPDVRSDLAMAHNNLGRLLNDLERLKEAETAYSEALAIKKQLAAEFPTRAQYREDLARCHHNLSVLLKKMGRIKEAEAACANAIVLQKQLVADFPNRPDLRRNLAMSYTNQGRFFSDRGQWEEAATAYQEALAIAKQLAMDSPNQPDLQNSVTSTLVSLAILSNDRGDYARAIAYAEEALPYHEAALKSNPRHPMYRHFYRSNWVVQLAAYAFLKDQAGVVRIATKLRDLGWDPPADAYEAARKLAQGILLVQQSSQGNTEERDKAIQFHGDEAMKMLQDAVGKGYKDVERMRKDNELDPIHERADFKKLISALEEKAKVLPPKP